MTPDVPNHVRSWAATVSQKAKAATVERRRPRAALAGSPADPDHETARRQRDGGDVDGAYDDPPEGAHRGRQRRDPASPSTCRVARARASPRRSGSGGEQRECGAPARSGGVGSSPGDIPDPEGQAADPEEPERHVGPGPGEGPGARDEKPEGGGPEQHRHHRCRPPGQPGCETQGGPSQPSRRAGRGSRRRTAMASVTLPSASATPSAWEESWLKDRKIGGDAAWSPARSPHRSPASFRPTREAAGPEEEMGSLPDGGRGSRVRRRRRRRPPGTRRPLRGTADPSRKPRARPGGSRGSSDR